MLTTSKLITRLIVAGFIFYISTPTVRASCEELEDCFNRYDELILEASITDATKSYDIVDSLCKSSEITASCHESFLGCPDYELVLSMIPESGMAYERGQYLCNDEYEFAYAITCIRNAYKKLRRNGECLSPYETPEEDRCLAIQRQMKCDPRTIPVHECVAKVMVSMEKSGIRDKCIDVYKMLLSSSGSRLWGWSTLLLSCFLISKFTK